MQPEKSLPKLAIVALTIVMASIMSEAAYSQGVSTPDSLCPWRGGANRCYSHVWLTYFEPIYSGVHGTIGVADPILRESTATSGAHVSIMTESGGWLELGWTKQASNHNCDPWLYWARNPGNPQFSGYLSSGHKIRLTIALVDEDMGWWLLKAYYDDTNQELLYLQPIATVPSFSRGHQLQANGEVGPHTTNDMGVSYLTNLKFRKQPGNGWFTWVSPYATVDPTSGTPYRVANAGADYNWDVWGGQGQLGYYCQ